MYKYLTRDYDVNNQDQIVLPAGNLRAIGLAFEGTNLSGQTLTLANLGSIRLYNPAGGKIWDVTLSRLWGMVNQKGAPGVNRFSSTTSAAIEAFFYIPFHWNRDFNICRLGTGWVLEYLHSDITAVTTTLVMTVMMQRGLGIQRYFPVYQDYNIRSLSAEVTPEDFPRKNLAFIHVTPTTNITNVRLEKDGNILYDATDEQLDFVVNAEKDNPNAYENMTTDSLPWVLDLYKEKNLTEVLGNNYKFGAVSSDTTITGMTVEFQLSDAAVDVTSQVMASIKEKNATTEAEKIVA